jgi:hypothetical protein
MVGWRALLDGALAERARTLTNQIADDLAKVPPGAPGLSDAAGRVLLFDYLDRGDDADAQLERVMAQRELRGPWLFDGLSGLAFVLAQLGADVDDGIDSALAARLRPDDHYDLISGVAGVGAYALERMPVARLLLESVIRWLDDHARTAPTGRYLFSAANDLGSWMRERYPDGVIDLGMAHGQGGAIVVAAGAATWGVSGALQLYEDLVAHLWSQQLSVWPFFGAAVGRTSGRAAWCYGAPGLAAALCCAAAAVGDDSGRRRALALASHTARDLRLLEVVESHLCHGAAGLAHMFNRLSQAAEGEDCRALAETSTALYERALALPRLERDDLLEGQLGLALALSAALSSQEPVWDRALGVSIHTHGLVAQV